MDEQEHVGEATGEPREGIEVKPGEEAVLASPETQEIADARARLREWAHAVANGEHPDAGAAEVRRAADVLLALSVGVHVPLPLIGEPSPENDVLSLLHRTLAYLPDNSSIEFDVKGYLDRLPDAERDEDELDELRTRSGRVLSDDEVEALADEAERGYDVDPSRGTHIFRASEEPLVDVAPVERPILTETGASLLRERGVERAQKGMSLAELADDMKRAGVRIVSPNEARIAAVPGSPALGEGYHELTEEEIERGWGPQAS